jgi:hypothetical protein
VATLRELVVSLAPKVDLAVFERGWQRDFCKLEAWATVGVRTEAARVAVVDLPGFERTAAGLCDLRWGEPWHGGRGGNLAKKKKAPSHFVLDR